jgi:hypothetical protein
VIGPTHKVLLTLGCLIPVPVVTTLLLVAGYSHFDGTPDDTVVAVLFGLYWALLGYAIAALIDVVLLVRRRRDLSHSQRRRWYFSAVFFNVFMLPVAWWRLIRPAPTT